MKFLMHRYSQNFIAFIPFFNIWYTEDKKLEAVCVGWLVWSAQFTKDK